MADRYDVQLSKGAARALRKLDRPVQARILAALALLRDDPRPATVKALSGHPGYLRVRVGDYRVIYTIEDDHLVVLVLTIGHRRTVYRTL
ncbi:type II toxin-antitoxin system RelE/ParE family toxin [Agrococcus citreus]|uniref:Type II toxin-antitoxin system RelE/ParE family toxin n=1 Tax=Agrococcus citreus TaxID=84643 RepID=A0ABN1YRE6_9MICO